MKKIVLLCLLLLITFGNTATAANWQYVLTTQKNDSLFLNVDTINTNRNGYIDVWSKWVFSPSTNAKISYYIAHEQYNKMARSMRYLSIYSYDKTGNATNEIVDSTIWYDIVPDSYSEVFYNTILRYSTNTTNREAQTL